MPDEVSAFRRCEEAECDGDQVADVVNGPGTGRPDEGFQFREGQFDRIEIRTVGRQVEEFGSAIFDRLADAADFVRGKVVTNHPVAAARRQWRHWQPLWDARQYVFLDEWA